MKTTLRSASFLFCFIVFVGFYSTINAQQRDAKIWTSVKIDQRFSKDFSSSLEQAWRFNNGGFYSEETFTEFGLEKEIIKNIKAGLGYRYGQQRHFFDADHIYHRVNIDLAFRKKINKLNLTFRTRYQVRYRDVLSSETGHIPLSFSRNKLTIKHSISKKLSIEAGAELFYKFFYKGNQFENYRLLVGLEYDLTKRFIMGMNYLVQNEINVNNPELDHIFSCGITYRPKKIKIKKNSKGNRIQGTGNREQGTGNRD